MAAGLDSLGAIEFQSAIAARFGTSMPATLVVDFPTIRSLLPAVVARACLLQPTRVKGTAAWQHQHAGTEGRAAGVLQETLAVIADVLGSSIQADTPFMEVRRLPCLSLPAPRQTSRLHMSACDTDGCSLCNIVEKTLPHMPKRVCRRAWTRWALCNCTQHWQTASAWRCHRQPCSITQQLVESLGTLCRASPRVRKVARPRARSLAACRACNAPRLCTWWMPPLSTRRQRQQVRLLLRAPSCTETSSHADRNPGRTGLQAGELLPRVYSPALTCRHIRRCSAGTPSVCTTYWAVLAPSRRDMPAFWRAQRNLMPRLSNSPAARLLCWTPMRACSWSTPRCDALTAFWRRAVCPLALPLVSGLRLRCDTRTVSRILLMCGGAAGGLGSKQDCVKCREAGWRVRWLHVGV